MDKVRNVISDNVLPLKTIKGLNKAFKSYFVIMFYIINDRFDLAGNRLCLAGNTWIFHAIYLVFRCHFMFNPSNF